MVQMGGPIQLISKFDIDSNIINATLFLRMFLRLDERLRADRHGKRTEKGHFHSILEVKLLHNY